MTRRGEEKNPMVKENIEDSDSHVKRKDGRDRIFRYSSRRLPGLCIFRGLDPGIMHIPGA